ncbi:NADP oxidoreductase [Luteitalea sp. TBR-22]|uniref:NADPH-dependent F420 reductase n=1 Tax=Luteitalea sp. TBR-22 TaxID=2802971 RepID=UPI001AFB6A3A|nr:NADPH-dependent F420 reductase [Luteitalea sp. TBR-22]BCS32251.1 NADP oxidoreductase [Luteitalea sp. TBR-22]
MRIACIGHGHVGGALAASLADLGHEVTIAAASSDDDRLRALASRAAVRVAPPADALRSADVVFLATPFGALDDVAATMGDALSGKVLVDCTNPVGPGLQHGLRSERSGSEAVQAALPRTRVVKAFSVYGYENFVRREATRGVRPMMPICGDDAASKALVAGLATELGWEAVDVGGLAQALHLEHMTLLWVRMVRVGGADPRLVWAALRG